MSEQYSAADGTSTTLTWLTPLFCNRKGLFEEKSEFFREFRNCGWQPWCI